MSDELKTDNQATPSPEALLAADEHELTSGDATAQRASIHIQQVAPTVSPRRAAYRPSHKGTFIGLSVVAIILAANAGIIAFVMRNQATADDARIKNGVTISAETLNKLGVSRDPVGGAETELIVGPNATFKGNVQMGGSLQVAGSLILNSRFTASEAAFTKLQSGDTQLQQLNVNGDATISTLNLRKDIQVAGATKLSGPLTVNQLTTINNNMNVAGNLAVGGSLSVRNFQVSNLTVAGHLISSGGTPAVSAGGGVGSNGTVSISGNDTSGTVSVNTGSGAGNGLLASISFATKYATTPHVVVSPVGRSVPGLYLNRTSAGFTISADGALPPGGYAFDYVVIE